MVVAMVGKTRRIQHAEARGRRRFVEDRLTEVVMRLLPSTFSFGKMEERVW